MKIGQMFERDINRNINGVVKVNQVDAEVVYQELDEYVVTKEILGHLRKFFNGYTDALDGNTDKIGIWVSGFFGSGKSHFIKTLSYLLENKDVTFNGITTAPLSFFEGKIEDAALVADIKRSVQQSTDVVLFNIDSKAEVHDANNKDTVLEVFMKVFNELEGYCSDIPELAELERYLDSKDKYNEFKAAYQKKAGLTWEDDRDAFRLIPDTALEVFAEITEQSMDATRSWYEKAEQKYTLSVEKFAKLVKEYLKKKGKDHRVIFLVDEVGQYIGENTQLMLNLQTIVEDLGVKCDGRAWVVVTSQEDIDAILGSIPGARANDFSKIQGRFNTRISLSGTNTDEVIKCRLLEKTPAAIKELKAVYAKSKDVLKNQICFTADCATMKSFESDEDFVRAYPCPPYQFDLLQKVFESIRKVGASGAHLAKGERSMLDSFQQAVRLAQKDGADVLIPFYDFYPAIQGFLEGVVIRTIDRAADNKSLQPFDQKVLKVLFLIRYINLIKPNLENLATLCVSRIDEDKIILRSKIEDSLVRLEKETLIQRNGDLYTFLTNEERDVMNAINSVDIEHLEQVHLVSDVIYRDIFGDYKKHRLASNGKDYDYNRICDGVFRGNANADVTIEVVSPLNEDYGHWNETRCIMDTADGTGKVVFKLKDDTFLGREIAQYVRIEKYVRLKRGGSSLSTSVEDILRKHKEENRQRLQRINERLSELFAASDVYVLGKKLTVNSDKADAVKKESLEYLITNTYRKLPYLASYCDSPSDAEKEIRAMMTSHGNGQIVLDLDDEKKHPNYRAFNEINEYLNIKFRNNDRITVKDLSDRYTGKPWGWPTWDTLLLIATLYRGGDIRLLYQGELLEFKKAIDPLTKTRYWANVLIQKQPTISEEDRKKAQDLVKDCFHAIPPADGEELASFITKELSTRLTAMKTWQGEASYASYPTKDFLNRFTIVFSTLAEHHTAADVLKEFAGAGDDLKEFADGYPLVEGFHKTQKTIFEDGRAFVTSREQNSSYYDGEFLKIWDNLNSILDDATPYSHIPKIKGYVQKLTSLDKAIVDEKRSHVLPDIEKMINELLELVKEVGADADQSNHAMRPLQEIKTKIINTESIDTILAGEARAKTAYEKSWHELEDLKESQGGETLKPVVAINASSISVKPYLESASDVEGYVTDLKGKLDKEIAAGKRIQIK